MLAVIGGWALLFTLISDPGSKVTGIGLDAFLVSLELLGIVAFCGLLVSSLLSLWLARARRAGWFNILCDILIALASVFLLWTAAEFHLLSLGTNF